MKEKNSKSMVVLVALLSLLLVGLGGYLIYDKNLSKESVKVNEEDNQTLIVFAKDLLEKYSFLTDLNDNDKKMLIALNNNKNNAYVQSCTALYSDTLNTEVGPYFVPLESDREVPDTGTCDGGALVFNYSTTNEMYKNLFGGEMSKKDLVYGGDYGYRLFDYKETTYNSYFVELIHNGGGMFVDYFVPVVKDVKIEEKNLIIDWASVTLYPDTNNPMADEVYDYYVSDNKDIRYSNDKVDNSLEEVKEDLLDNHYDVMNKVQYVFELDDYHYVLKDIKVK